jgi:hypothetical protein
MSGAEFTRNQSHPMNIRNLSKANGICRNAILALLALPSLAMAHPGHFHPGEEDDFDSIRANFLHLHGTFEISLALLALAAAVVFQINRNRRIRVGAALAFGGSLAFIAAI